MSWANQILSLANSRQQMWKLGVSQLVPKKLEGQADSGMGVTIGDCVYCLTLRAKGSRLRHLRELLSSTFCPMYLVSKPFGFLRQQPTP